MKDIYEKLTTIEEQRYENKVYPRLSPDKDESSIQKCSTNTILNENTSINRPNLANNKPISKGLNRPIPNKYFKSRGQKTRPSLSERIKPELNKWISEVYQPTHFLTVRLPSNWESSYELNSRPHLRMIMKVFEQKLLGCHWNKHHLPFICFAEQGSGTVWHYHILFNQGKFSEKELENAILEARTVLKLPLYCLYLENINCSEDRVKNYCHKEVEIYWNGKVNSDRFILSADLFNLPYKKTSSIN